MRENKRGTLYLCIFAILLNLGLLTACSYHTEPEQIYPVSAIGFDRAEDGIRVTVEIALADGERPAVCYSQTGQDIAAALCELADGLPRSLIYSHCALAVMGEDLTKEQMQEIFAFAGVEDGLPLAAEVVVSKNAEALLRGERLSSVAAGYEIPQILEQERVRRGIELPCQIYRLRAVFSPDLPVALPRFDRMEEEPAARFVGVDILRPNAPAYSLDAADCVSHAVLTNTYTGGEKNGIWWCVLREKMEISSDGAIVLILRLEVEGRTSEEITRLTAELEHSAEDLYRRVTDAVGEDLFWLEQRMKGMQWSKETALTVKCEVG